MKTKIHITRKQYMADSPNLHHQYWSQFITPATIDFVKNQIGIDKIRASKCQHLNDVAPWLGGGKSWLWDYTPYNTELMRELGEIHVNTPSNATCVGKAAARILLQQESK